MTTWAETGWAVFTSISLILFICGLTASNMYLHLVHYTRPHLQAHILRILIVTPIISFFSFLALVSPKSAGYPLHVLRDVWEAVVIYSFLMLVLEYMGGEHLCLNSISGDNATNAVKEFRYWWPLSLCFGPIPPEKMIRLPKRCALQFVVAKPIMTLFELILYLNDSERDLLARFLVNCLYNISYSIALFGLYLIYTASKNHVALQGKYCLLKFVSVKMVVFLTFWQSYLFPSFVSTNPEAWQDFVLIVECAVFTILMSISFSWSEFALNTEGAATILSTGLAILMPGVFSSASGEKCEPSTFGAGAGGARKPHDPTIEKLDNQFVTSRPRTETQEGYLHYAAGQGANPQSVDLHFPPMALPVSNKNRFYGESSDSDVKSGTHTARVLNIRRARGDARLSAGSHEKESSNKKKEGNHRRDAWDSSNVLCGDAEYEPRVIQLSTQTSTSNSTIGKRLVQLDTYDMDNIGNSSEGSPQPTNHVPNKNSGYNVASNRYDANAIGNGSSSFGGSTGSTAKAFKIGALGPSTLPQVEPGDDRDPNRAVVARTSSDKTTEVEKRSKLAFSKNMFPAFRDTSMKHQNEPKQNYSGMANQAQQETKPSGEGANSVTNAITTSPKNVYKTDKATPQWLANARNAFNPKDVISDAKRSFSTRYNQHVLMETDAQADTLDAIDEFHIHNASPNKSAATPQSSDVSPPGGI